MSQSYRTPQNVLVLGASGKLGRMLRLAWDKAPPNELVPQWVYRNNAPPGGHVWQPGDAMPPTLPGIDAILALWGVTPAPGRKLSENTTLALAAMELAQNLGARRVLHCSSAAVYEPGPSPRSEADAGGAINPYGAAKLDMEAALQDWCAAHPQGATSVSMRIANVVGADSLFASIARGDGPITLDRFENGQGPWRSYISIAALSRVFEALLTCDDAQLPAALNVASPSPVAMEALARAAGQEIAWRPAPSGAAPMVALDTSALQAITECPEETPEQMIAAWRAVGGGA